MSLTVTKHPIGHKLSTQDVEAEVIDDGQGNALVYTGSGHGLSDGDYVYIESDLEGYNGYLYVDSIQYDAFKIKESENGDYIAFEQEADITYRPSVLNHGWQCAHLPIVYELTSDLWPNNVAEEEYTPNVIESFQNNNGYTQINLDRAIANVTALNFVELIPPDPDYTVQGPYQIISVEEAWAIVINLAYDPAFDFSGYQVVNYYNNYNANVEVWAGLATTNRWYEKKPFELAATLKFIPDSEGKCLFSIHEILKGYVATRNNLLLNTLPNNVDFHVGFYIKFFESYDQSDGETITTETGSVTTDGFEGRAINAMLPFKSLDAGHMSEYLNEGDYLSRWLTVFDRPIAVVDRFFDISFLNQYDSVDIQILRNGELFQTLENPGSGVVRVMFIPEAGFTEYCLQAQTTTAQTPVSFTSFVNLPGPDTNWTTGATPSVSGTSDTLYGDYNFISGRDYTIQFTRSSHIGLLRIKVMDDSFNDLDGENFGGGSGVETFTFTAPEGTTKIGFVTNTVSSVTLSNLSVSTLSFEITERICIDIVEECHGTFVNDSLRLTEGRQLRELE